jgi:hypothetical protein
MKKLITKGVIALGLLLLSSTGLFAQTINMGANPINFGTGCHTPYIRSTTANNYTLQFGYFQGCFGPTYSQDQIYMEMDNGRLGIGVAAPAYQIHLSANSAGKPGSSTWTIVSDKRLKSDVNGFSDGLATVRGIKPITFHYNAASGYDTKPEYVGVLAQELQEVAPYMVAETQITDAAGKVSDYLAVDLGAMDFVLVNSIKELDAELQLQKAENEILRSALTDIRAEIEALKSGHAPATTVAPGIIVTPNPVATEAKITCTLPKGTQSALVQVIGLDGTVYSSLHVDPNLQTPMILATQDMAAGTYILKLMADGKLVATSRLVTTH